jgi:hypothetical protein
MRWSFPLTVPCLDTKTNAEYTKTFDTEHDFTIFIEGQFKVPGEYNLVDTHRWQDAGTKYASTVTLPNFEGGRYCDFPKDSFKERQFFNKEKEKVLKGVIIDNVYIPPFYYWYLNYCPIYNDVTAKKSFPIVWDSDLWFFQYIMLCMLKSKHAVVVKARQRGYSLKIMALLYWSYAWFELSVNTVGAYKEDYVIKSWRFLGWYREHINKYTRWYRAPFIPKALAWEELTQLEEGGTVGLGSKLSGTTFKVSPENGVGGNQSVFFYEEAGIAPTLLKTVGFVRPALEKGVKVVNGVQQVRTTGLIICSGAVGELDDAEDLKEIFYSPTKHNFLPVKNIWDNDENANKPCGLFISEAYNLEGFIDKNGNSLVEDALNWINKNKAEVQKNKRKDLAQLDISQKPTSPKEAFAQRKSSEFPIELLTNQQLRIRLKDKEGTWTYPPQKGLLEEKDGKIVLKPTDSEEMVYPVNPDIEDKRGIVTIFEPPDSNPPLYRYFAGVDPVEADDAVGSESLFSIHIFKTVCEVEYEDEEGNRKKRIEGDKIVATYYGRFASVEQTNEMGWFLIKMYNAYAFVERSKPNFINYMLRHGRGHYLAKESDVPFFKDMNLTSGESKSKYGFITTAQNEMWKHIKNYIKEYLRAEYGYSYKSNSDEVVKTYRGTDRIDDYYLLEELIRYVEGKGNYDKIVSFAAALMIAKIYQTNNIGIQRTSEIKQKQPRVQRRVEPVSLLTGQKGYRKTKSLLG